MPHQTFHGSIKVSQDGRYFTDNHGLPFFWLGDTAWPLFAEYTLENAKRYLLSRVELGYTVIQGVLAWGGGTGFETRSPGQNALGQAPWLEGNPLLPNNAYFQNVDTLVKFAGENNLILGLLPTWGYYVNDVQTLTVENAFGYGQWLGERYKDSPNIVWILGGDRIPTGFEEVTRHLAAGLRSGDGGTHLLTYHICGERSSAQFFHTEDWLDFNMLQTWTAWPRVYPSIQTDTMLSPAKPVVLGEGAYEAGPEYPLGPITPLIVRRQAWWAFMAGGFFTNGHNQNWRMESNWEDILTAPGAAQMQIYKQIITSRTWWQMIPDQCMFEVGISSDHTLNAAKRTADSTCAMIYLSSYCHTRLNLDRILTKRVRATWINPQNGEKKDAGDYATGNRTGSIFPQGQKVWFQVPDFWEDAVLVLDGYDQPQV
jgi:Protein of unknown function (DUF4038)/Putative collagen-binding domain of a collagenase